MRAGNAWIMLKKARLEGASLKQQLGLETQSLPLFIDDVNRTFQRAKLFRATILKDLHDTVYGELQYGAEDLDGHYWLFSRHARDVSPEEWGATVSTQSCQLKSAHAGS
jgi:uncharacterized glyoxalase superfamily protein PhnB